MISVLFSVLMLSGCFGEHLPEESSEDPPWTELDEDQPDVPPDSDTVFEDEPETEYPEDVVDDDTDTGETHNPDNTDNPENVPDDQDTVEDPPVPGDTDSGGEQGPNDSYPESADISGIPDRGMRYFHPDYTGNVAFTTDQQFGGQGIRAATDS